MKICEKSISCNMWTFWKLFITIFFLNIFFIFVILANVIFRICHPSSIVFNESCFWITADKQFRDGAIADCANSYGARLATANSVDEQWMLYYASMTSPYIVLIEYEFHIGLISI